MPSGHLAAMVDNLMRRFVPAVFPILLLSGCAGGLEPVDAPEEWTPPPSAAPLWQVLESTRQDDWFHVLNVGSEAFDWRLRAIDSAVESIDLQTFIWDLDAVGHQVRDHLLAAAARGVFVRVLVDDSFILDADQELLDIDRHDNIELKVFNPYKRRSSHVALRQVLNAGEFQRLDHRMHNKVMVVDNRAAIVGGRNLATHYFGYHENENFRDMEVVAGGPVVSELAAGFDRYWNDRWSFPVEAILEQRAGPGRPGPSMPEGSLEVDWHDEQTAQERLSDWIRLARSAHAGRARLVLDRPPEDNPSEEDEAPVQVGEVLVQAIDAAEEEVWLVSAYLIPTEPLEAAIQRAEERGVQVRILTNSINSNNHLTAHSAYRNHVERLVKMGADVHEVRYDAKDRGLYIASPVEDKSLCLHAKILIFDDEAAFVGSANLDPRSLRINTEMGLLIESPSLNSELRSALAPDFALRNAWHLRLNDDGRVIWVSDDAVLDHQPTHSFMRRIEDWFLSRLPLEDEM
jgi:putative cardiolipin synthase